LIDRTYRLPARFRGAGSGKELKTSRTVHDGTTRNYIARRRDRGQRLPMPHYTIGREHRVQRDVSQTAREYARVLIDTDAFSAVVPASLTPSAARTNLLPAPNLFTKKCNTLQYFTILCIKYYIKRVLDIYNTCNHNSIINII